MQTQSVSREIQPLADVASLALEEARRQGASECEADASLGRGLSVSVRLREVDTIEYQRDRGLAVTVYFGKRKGSASTADLSTSAVRETVDKACAIARYTAEDPYAGLVEPEALAREIPDLDLDHPWDVTPERAIELARECEAAGLAVDPRLANSEGAAVNSQRQTGVYGNSLGFLAGYSATSHSVSCTLIAEAGEDMQRDYWFTVARDAADLEAVASVGRTAGERALARLGARRLTTRKVPVAFPAFLEMLERPHIPRGLASSPFDQEGAATRDRELVRDGVLGGYVLGSYSARRLGLKTTGNAGGAHNLLVRSQEGALDPKAFLGRLGTGLLVTELMGHGVNGVTGDYSRGASGFWVEQGAIAYPVHEITIAGNLKPMYRHIVALGDDVDVRGGIRTGSLLLDEMTVAGE
ncbi:MAG: metalloprotease PmbA [Gammaproteobacteria bacterium]|nr:MAG: metalloprotease PmbA [Gammaproteobacteria bacterium]